MDKPVPKKPVQKAETVVQSASPMNKPIAEESGENWLIAVFTHPIVKSRFSYQLTVNGRVRHNPGYVDEKYPNLFGCFGTPQEAIAAAREEVEE